MIYIKYITQRSEEEGERIFLFFEFPSPRFFTSTFFEPIFTCKLLIYSGSPFSIPLLNSTTDHVTYASFDLMCNLRYKLEVNLLYKDNVEVRSTEPSS